MTIRLTLYIECHYAYPQILDYGARVVGSDKHASLLNDGIIHYRKKNSVGVRGVSKWLTFVRSFSAEKWSFEQKKSFQIIFMNSDCRWDQVQNQGSLTEGEGTVQLTSLY